MRRMIGHRVKECACLNCGKVLDGASQATGDNAPGPGDITVCIYCGHIQAFDIDMSLRALTDAEVVEAAGDPVIVRINNLRAEFPWVSESSPTKK